MKKEIIICDKCGCDIKKKSNYHSHIEIELEWWHGGSIGGREDVEEINIDLCDDCARVFAYNLKNWLKDKRQ